MILCRLPELMDQPSLGQDERAEALQLLNRINRRLGVDRRLCDWVRGVAGSESVSVLDLGSGGGGLLGYMVQRNGTAGPLRLIGLDQSLPALKLARRWQDSRVRWIRGDALHIPLADSSVDLVTCSLFLHHFDEGQVVQILRGAARVAKKGIVIGDLTRSRLALVSTWLFTHLASRSPVCHYDAAVSVRAAYNKEELAGLAAQAGLNNTQVRSHFPFRMILIWNRSETKTT